MITPGQTLNNTYKIIEQIGSGGGGIVFKAYHLRLEKHVAIKLIKDKVKGKMNERAEADILKQLKHDGLPQVYDFINDGEDVYTVMEYINGHSLNDEIIKRGKIPYKQALKWTKELCSAAAYLHSRKPAIIHSDIKPKNIMVTYDGNLCLIDFNISSVFGGDIYTIGSSDGYSPPEQYLARKQVRPVAPVSVSASPSRHYGDTEILIEETSIDATEILTDDRTEVVTETEVVVDNSDKLLDSCSDVYSIGAVMYSMLTGMKPNNSRGVIKPLKKLDPNIPEAMVYIVEKAMCKEKSGRFASAVEMLEALENINKLDKRYKRLALRKQLAFIFCLVLFTASAIASIAGYRLMQTETGNKLNSYIQQMNAMSEKNNFSDFDSVYASATSEFPESAEPHYYKAYMLYSSFEYETAEKYMSESLMNKVNELPADLQASSNFMYADILFRKEDYQNAVTYYEKALVNGSDSPDVYRDFAISLARTGNAESAEQVLALAVERGLAEDGIYMVTGEIHFIRNEYSEAVEALKNGIAISDNAELKRNAYLVCSRAYEAMYMVDNEQLILDNAALLEEALLTLPQSMTMQVKEYLAQAYIDYGEITSRDDYFAKAITLLEDIKYSSEFRNYQTDMNLAVLCDKIGNSQTAKELLLDMATVPEYELNYYIIYIRAAYCEADIQGELDVTERDYSEFDKYYKSAEEEYKKYIQRGNSDPEMEKLTQLRNEMVSLGWLK